MSVGGIGVGLIMSEGMAFDASLAILSTNAERPNQGLVSGRTFVLLFVIYHDSCLHLLFSNIMQICS